MDGILNFHKPTGITSAKALYRVRKITGIRKSGHAGTLDPAAEGVLVLCLGKGTKLVESIMGLPKVYRTTCRLDVTSDSYDSEGDVREVKVESIPTEQQVADALASFEGEIQQIPPGISAVKVGGIPAYKRIRTGETVELKARPAMVYWIVLHSYQWPVVDFEMACGRGTYVRSIARDLGEKLNTGGCLTSLLRSRIGPFSLDESCSYDSLEDQGTEACLLELEAAKELLNQPIEIPERP